jgi:hypothetical protein
VVHGAVSLGQAGSVVSKKHTESIFENQDVKAFFLDLMNSEYEYTRFLGNVVSHFPSDADSYSTRRKSSSLKVTYRYRTQSVQVPHTVSTGTAHSQHRYRTQSVILLNEVDNNRESQFFLYNGWFNVHVSA